MNSPTPKWDPIGLDHHSHLSFRTRHNPEVLGAVSAAAVDQQLVPKQKAAAPQRDAPRSSFFSSIQRAEAGGKLTRAGQTKETRPGGGMKRF